jgi:hypothetical protein
MSRSPCRRHRLGCDLGLVTHWEETARVEADALHEVGPFTCDTCDLSKTF